MIFQPAYPNDQVDRKKAIQAALIVEKCLAKTRWLEACDDQRRAKATFNGLIGCLVSQNIAIEHLNWAMFELRCHANGGHA